MITVSRFNESKNNKLPVKKGVLYFSDIKQSSKLWASSPKDMMNALDEHFKRVNKIAKKFNGLIVKTIGDAFMIKFDSLEDALNTAVSIQDDLFDDPIKIKSKKLQIRIGICGGEIYEKTYTNQGNSVKDFFGEAVNAASRLEHEVSDTNGIAIGSYDKINFDELSELANDLYHVDILDYRKTCSKHINRSGRLLTDRHRYMCKDISKLNGIKPIKVMNFTRK